MALKKTIRTSFGIDVTYEDLFATHATNSNGKKSVSMNLRGWPTKALCRTPNAHMWEQSYNFQLTDDENAELYALLYKLLKAHVTDFADAAAVYDVSSVTLDKTELSLAAGGTGQITATCTPDTASDLTIIWASSDTAIATVDDTGLVTAVATGTATITASSNDEPSVTASCAVTVA
jgi:uncharacterized protein YjdB